MPWNQHCVRLTDAEAEALRKWAERQGVSPTRCLTVAAIRALQASRMSGFALSLDDSHATLNRTLPAIAEQLRSGALSPGQAATLIEGAHAALSADFAEMLGSRAALVSYRDEDDERSGIDWSTGRPPVRERTPN